MGTGDSCFQTVSCDQGEIGLPAPFWQINDLLFKCNKKLRYEEQDGSKNTFASNSQVLLILLLSSSSKDTANCEVKSCVLHPYRLSKGRPSVKVIKSFCLECMNEETNGTRAAFELVKKCPAYDCPLYPFRHGHNPNRTGKGNIKGSPENLKNRYVRPCN